jgi:hypothetical protein
MRKEIIALMLTATVSQAGLIAEYWGGSVISSSSYSAFVTTLRSYNPDYLFTAYDVDAGTNYMTSTGSDSGNMMLTNGMTYTSGALPWIRGGNGKTANGIAGAANGANGLTVLWAGKKKSSPSTGGSFFRAVNSEGGETGIGNQTSFKFSGALAYTAGGSVGVNSVAQVTNGEFCVLFMTHDPSLPRVSIYKNGSFDSSIGVASMTNKPAIRGEWFIGKRTGAYTDLSTVAGAIWTRVLTTNEMSAISSYIISIYGGVTL